MCPKWPQKVTNPDKISLTLHLEKARRSQSPQDCGILQLGLGGSTKAESVGWRWLSG